MDSNCNPSGKQSKNVVMAGVKILRKFANDNLTAGTSHNNNNNNNNSTDSSYTEGARKKIRVNFNNNKVTNNAVVELTPKVMRKDKKVKSVQGQGQSPRNQRKIIDAELDRLNAKIVSIYMTNNLIQLMLIDPFGQPKVTGGMDPCFRTCCPSVRPHFSNLEKQNNRKQCSLLA